MISGEGMMVLETMDGAEMEPHRVLVIDDGAASKMALASIMGALAGAVTPLFLEDRAPRVKPVVRHDRHQGTRERARRLKKTGQRNRLEAK